MAGGEGTPYNGLYGLLVYERAGILLVEVYKRVGKSVTRSVKRPKRANR